jgi:hypothetical protein
VELRSEGFSVPKAGSSEADYEDAIAIGPTAVAIADGATESSFARAWAQALTEGFACDPLSPKPDLTELMERVGPLQKQWHAGIAWDRLPWFAEDKARNGAFAALLTLRFEAPAADDNADGIVADRRWHALAIGDTCLFQVRDDALHLAFPLSESAAFDSTPLLLSSNPARNLQVWDHAQALTGLFKPGDTMLLMTDALAKWFLSEAEAGRKPWHILCAVTEQAEFTELTQALRAAHRLKNDDTSLIRVQETNVASFPASVPEQTPETALPADATVLSSEPPPPLTATVEDQSSLPDVTASTPDMVAEDEPNAWENLFEAEAEKREDRSLKPLPAVREEETV